MSRSRVAGGAAPPDAAVERRGFLKVALSAGGAALAAVASTWRLASAQAPPPLPPGVPPPPPPGAPPAPPAGATPPRPPAPVTEAIPASPGPNYTWVPGHWAWRPYLGRYVWISGRYFVPAYPNYVWVPGHWGWGPVLGYHWIEGHWRVP